jgi:hypothetical protein
MHDVVGQYNRFDIFEFNINRNKLKPLHEQSEQEQTQPNQTSQLKNLPESESARQPPEASDSTPNK